MSRDNAHLHDILDSARLIRQYLEGLSLSGLEGSVRTQDAVIRRFEIMGEAARRLSPEARKLFPDVPWDLMTGMRNILIHDYDEVSLRILHQTAQNDLPSLIEQLESYLAQRPPP
jgi:uncharacterized protein with HEPN domain